MRKVKVPNTRGEAYQFQKHFPRPPPSPTLFGPPFIYFETFSNLTLTKAYFPRVGTILVRLFIVKAAERFLRRSRHNRALSHFKSPSHFYSDPPLFTFTALKHPHLLRPPLVFGSLE